MKGLFFLVINSMIVFYGRQYRPLNRDKIAKRALGVIGECKVALIVF